MSDNVLSITTPIESSITLARASVSGQLSEGESIDRMDLLNRQNAGEHIELDIDAMTYVVGPEVINHNFNELSVKAVKQFAKTSVNTPLTREHRTSADDIGGFVLKSKVQKSDQGHELHETIRLNEPWAVKAALNGNMRKFSIHWEPVPMALVHCSACKDSILACEHMPGEVLEKRGKQHTVSMISQEAVAIERSWVFRPAVPAAEMKSNFLSRISELRSEALAGLDSETRDKLSQMNPHQEKRPPMDITELSSMLGCEDSDTSVTTAIKAKLAMVDDLTSELSDARTEIETLKSELKTHLAAKLAAECDNLITELHTAGLKKDGAMESLIRDSYLAGDTETAEKLSTGVREMAGQLSDPLQHKSVETTLDRTYKADELLSQLYELHPERERFFKSKSDELGARKLFETYPELLSIVAPGLDAKDLQ